MSGIADHGVRTMAWTAKQALRTDDLPHRALMGEKEAARRKPKQAPDIDKRQRIRDALTADWQTLRQLMERSGCSKWLVYDELSGAVDEGYAEAAIDGGAKRARLYRRAR